MSMFIEVFSDDVEIHGDGETTVAEVNLVGWPFNLDVSEAGAMKLAASIVTPGAPEVLEQIECVQSGTFLTLTFPEAIPGGESKLVRLRAKVFV